MARGRRLLPHAPLPEAQWPEPDRLAWAAALAPPPDPLDDGGAACDWRPSTAAFVALRYGHWLAWLQVRGALDPSAEPVTRATRVTVRAYRDYLQAHLAPTTVVAYLLGLHEVLRVMQPDADLGWLRAAINRLNANAPPKRDKAAQIVGSDRLLQAGLDLLAASAHEDAAGARARQYRNGLLTAFLALRPLRLANLAGLRIGRTLVIEPGAAWVRLPGAEVKNHRPLEVPWPTHLLEPLTEYLEQHRPVLLDGGHTDGLWVGRGTALTKTGCAQVVRQVTREAFGFEIPPHRFRDNAATTIALAAPEEVGIIRGVLGHADHRTGERHYNQATCSQAARPVQAVVTAMRTDRLQRQTGRTERP